MSEITVFTDGAAKSNGKKDAIGSIGIYFEGEPHNSYYELVTSSKFKTKVTNNLTELYAIQKAIELANKYYPERKGIHLYTDSKYAYSIFTSWATKWKANGWVKADKKPILNLSFIQTIYEYKQNQKIIFYHCNSHRTPPPIKSPEYRVWYGNDQADKLANKAIDEQ